VGSQSWSDLRVDCRRTCSLSKPANGVTEGHIHCLELVKHQGYGRAGFALLRQCVLPPAQITDRRRRILCPH